MLLFLTVLQQVTSSSAVAERPRDALCPSVVSLNKIINHAEFFFIIVTNWASDLPLRDVVFGVVTLRLLVIHFVVVSHYQQTPPLTSDYGPSQLNVLHLPLERFTLTARSEARYWLRIAIST